MKIEKTWGLALSALAVVSGFAVWYLDILSKHVSISLVSTVSLSSPDLALFRGVKLSVADNAVVKPQLTILRLTNTGFKEVRTSDFEAPITITLASEGKIIAAAPSGSNREQLQAVITTRESNAEISPLLLNRGDAVSIAILVDGDLPQFKVTTRIAGVPEPSLDLSDPQQKKESNKLASKFLVMLCSFVLFLYVFIFVDLRSSEMTPSEDLVFPSRSRFRTAVVLGGCAIAPVLVVLNELDTSFGRHDIVTGAWILGLAALAGALVLWKQLNLGTRTLEASVLTLDKNTNEA